MQFCGYACAGNSTDAGNDGGRSGPWRFHACSVGAERVGEHETSMLQDLEAGRQMEIDAVIGSVLEIAGITGVSMPQTRTVYALVKKLNEHVTGTK